MDMKYPERVIIVVTSHGNISIKNNAVETFRILPGIVLTKVSQAVQGECTLYSPEYISSKVEVIKTSFFNEYKYQYKTIPEIIKLVISIFDTSDRNERKTYSNLKELKKQGLSNSTIKIFKDTLYHLNKS